MRDWPDLNAVISAIKIDFHSVYRSSFSKHAIINLAPSLKPFMNAWHSVICVISSWQALYLSNGSFSCSFNVSSSFSSFQVSNLNTLSNCLCRWNGISTGLILPYQNSSNIRIGLPPHIKRAAQIPVYPKSSRPLSIILTLS